jgi:hypothetical protein
MFRKFYYLNIFLGALLIVVVLGLQLFFARYFRRDREKIRLVIPIQTEQQRAALQQFFPDQPLIARAKSLEVTTGWQEFLRLQEAGLNPEILVEMQQQELIDPHWPTLAEIDSIMASLAARNSVCCRALRIGRSAFYQWPLYCVRISDWSRADQEQPAVLFTAGHHGNEPLGVAICLHLIDSLCQGCGHNAMISNWVSKFDIYIVPLINPDGYRIVREERMGLVWRKNLRDNDGDGRFSPTIDGVDLNRNYGGGGELAWGSHFYAGPAPFSEPETQAIRDLAQQAQFVAHLDFHSAGEAVLYPVSPGQTGRKSDPMALLALALAQQVPKKDGLGHYRIAPLEQTMGQCATWMHREFGIKSFIIEAGDSYFPAGDEIDGLVRANARAAFWLLEQLAAAQLGAT